MMMAIFLSPQAEREEKYDPSAADYFTSEALCAAPDPETAARSCYHVDMNICGSFQVYFC